MGEWYFIIRQGTASVQNATGEEVNRLGKGDCFGELALLQSCPRTATVVATTTLRVWVTPVKDFLAVLEKASSKRSAEVKKSIDNVALFRSLSDEQRNRLSEAACFDDRSSSFNVHRYSRFSGFVMKVAIYRYD